MTERFFVNDPGASGPEFFETEKEAMDAANEIIGIYRDIGSRDREWPDEAAKIVVGRITHHSAFVPVPDHEDGVVECELRAVEAA